MKNIQGFETFAGFTNPQPTSSIQENHEGESNNYMFFSNLKTIKRSIEELLALDPSQVDQVLDNGHGWALDHIATSADDIDEVYHFLVNEIEDGGHEEEHHEMPEMPDETEETEEVEEGPEGEEEEEIEEED